MLGGLLFGRIGFLMRKLLLPRQEVRNPFLGTFTIQLFAGIMLITRLVDHLLDFFDRFLLLEMSHFEAFE